MTTDTSRLPFAPLTNWGLLDRAEHMRSLAGLAAQDAVAWETTKPHLVAGRVDDVRRYAREAHALTVAYGQRQAVGP